MIYNIKPLCLLALILASTGLFACKSDNNEMLTAPVLNGDTMKLKITVGERILTATLYDTPASKDFAALLPLTLTLTDYNETEKISDLPKKLSTNGAPAGHKPDIGDITYYAPWGNLALFYKEFSYSAGLVSLGKLDNGIDAFNGPGPVQVKIELIP